jgi:hypothetical protein
MDSQNVNDPTNVILNVISGFHRWVEDNCVLLCYYAGSSDDLLPTFRDQVVPERR